jgi:predicted 3-demethylubiquinone-9 3-methyltransferase (glyoxalase superfamily)
MDPESKVTFECPAQGVGADRALAAMMKMSKIDVAALERA